MPSAEEMFQHAYNDSLKELELNKLKNEVELKELAMSIAVTPPPDTPPAEGRVILLEEYGLMIDQVAKDLKTEKPDPELILRKGFKALNRVAEFGFLVENLLESVKRDDSLRNSVERYRALELLKSKANTNFKDETKNSPFRSNPGSGLFLRKLLQRLSEVALTLMELVCNAIKLVPKLISLKPKPSIGLSGPFPTFSLEFELEAEAITIHDLFEGLKGTVSERSV